MTQKLPFSTYQEYLDFVEYEWNVNLNHTFLIQNSWVLVDMDYGLGPTYRDLTEEEFNDKIQRLNEK
jgi:hypothetical protein